MKNFDFTDNELLDILGTDKYDNELLKKADAVRRAGDEGNLAFQAEILHKLVHGKEASF